MRTPRRSIPAFLRTILVPAALLAASPAAAQDAVPGQPRGEFGCTVGFDSPCRGRVDFDKGRSFEFKVGAPGTAVFTNEGNRRCTLEYSVTQSDRASTGQILNLAPGQRLELPTTNPAGLIVRFFHHGYGSFACDLLVELKG